MTEDEAIFVQEYVRTGDPLLAITTSQIRHPAYSLEVTAQQLLARPDIKEAVERARTASNGEVVHIRHTRDSLIANVQHVYDRALQESDFGTALNAMKEVGTLLGLRVEKKEVMVESKPENMRTADIVRLLQELKGKQYVEIEPPKNTSAASS